jgi:hypothetical protein
MQEPRGNGDGGGVPCLSELEARGGIEPPMRVLRTLALPLGYRPLDSRVREQGPPQLVSQDDRPSDILHRTTLLPALPPQNEVGLFLAQSKIAL